jgi:nitroreductase
MGEFVAIQERNPMRIDWIPRAFSDRRIDPIQLRCLLEVASRTPSHLNEQPWSFILTDKDEAEQYERLLGCLAETTAEWAKRAPVLMLAVVRLNDSNGRTNRHAFRDVRHYISNLIARAAGIGLTAHQLAGFDAARAERQFEIPSGYASMSVIALGYAAVPARSTSSSERATNGSRPLESFVFGRSWGLPSSLLGVGTNGEGVKKGVRFHSGPLERIGCPPAAS